MKDDSVEFARVTGRDESGLVVVAGQQRIDRRVRADWMALCKAAAREGFELAAVSSYRSFDRQLGIWNEKASGVRAVLNDASEPIDIAQLEPLQRLHAILRYSALPGASRHHWGSDLDVIDRASIEQDYQVQLVVEECSAPGPFAALHDWLDQRIASGRAYGFFRPYASVVEYGCGVASEPWHLSHGPLAQHFEALINYDAMLAFYKNLPNLALQDVLIANFDNIYKAYIAAPPRRVAHI